MIDTADVIYRYVLPVEVIEEFKFSIKLDIQELEDLEEIEGPVEPEKASIVES